MNRKRNADDDDDDCVPSSSSVFSSPTKRARRDTTESSFPQTPASSSRKLPFETPKTPYTPYPLQASDSPSNPFGRKRRERIIHSLPPISSFSKHICLRFQFIRSGISPRQGGVYRVVRVPKNYTFTHLRALIAWLFETPARYANGKGGEEEYLFEVMSKTALYSPLYKPGQIKSATTTVKLSNVRDPGRWRPGNAFGSDEDEDELGEGEEGDLDELGSHLESEENADVDEDWKWSDEEDFTLAHAWHRGIDPLISIVYHQSPSTQIHITVNTTQIPRQRGISNTPFVFSARGHVHLSPPPLPRPLFTKSILDTLSSSPVAPPPRSIFGRWQALKRPRSPSPPQAGSLQQRQDELSDTDADGDIDQETQPFNSNHPFFQSEEVYSSPCKKRRRDEPEPVILVEDSETEDEEVEVEDPAQENQEAMPNLLKWNEPKHAFALYLLQFMDPLGYPYDDIDESFFEEDKVYDPFDDDSDVEEEKPIKKRIFHRPPPPPPKQEQEEEYEYEYEYDDSEEQNAERVEQDEEGVEEDEIDLAESEKDDEEGEDDEAEYEEYEDYEDDDPHQYTLGSTPGLTHCDSSSPPRSLYSPSLYPFASSSLPDLSIVLEEHYPNKKYSHTPAPPKARKHRLRLTRLEKRLEKIKKTEFLCKYDEVEEAPVVEVDELEEEYEDEEEEDKWKPPVLKEGEVWDPFGDESEI